MLLISDGLEICRWGAAPVVGGTTTACAQPALVKKHSKVVSGLAVAIGNSKVQARRKLRRHVYRRDE